MKPVIGITTFSERKQMKLYCTVSTNYIQSVQMAGGLPLLLPILDTIESASEYIEGIDGLLLTGGEDVSPLFYGENPIKEVEYFAPERDELEMAFFKSALKRDIPVLGICRGLQIMNTSMGGTLYQDIFSQVKNSMGHFPKQLPVDNLYHSVTLEENSQLFNIFSKSKMNINSYHHQSIKSVADIFKVTARADDQIIEGIEHREKKHVMAVQWHPEDLTVKHPQFLKLFENFVQNTIQKK